MFTKMAIFILVLFTFGGWWFWSHKPMPATGVGVVSESPASQSTSVDPAIVETSVDIELPPISPGTTLHQKIYRNGELEWVERSVSGVVKRWRLDRDGQRYLIDENSEGTIVQQRVQP